VRKRCGVCITRDHNGCPDGTIPGIWRNNFQALCFFGFQQQISAYLLAQGPQDIQLLVVVLGAAPHPGFADLAEPFRAVPWGIHFFGQHTECPNCDTRPSADSMTRVRSLLMVR